MHVMLQGVLLRCTLVFVCCSSLVCALVTPPLAGAAARLVAETVTDNSTSSRYIQRPKCGDDASPLSTAEEGNPFSQLWNNTIAICAIARKEHIEDIREWLQYHRYGLISFELNHASAGPRNTNTAVYRAAAQHDVAPAPIQHARDS